MLNLIKAALKRNRPFVFESALLPQSQRRVQKRIEHLDMSRIASYHSIVGWKDTPDFQIHPCYLHLHAFDQHMQLMLNDEFPFALLGIVHLTNQIEVLRPVEVGTGIDLASEIVNFERHVKGITFSIESTIKQHSNVIWRSSSKFLAINGKARTGKTRGVPFKLPGDLQLIDKWHCDKRIGRQYGKVSGDLNPIHLSQLSAKIFGFKSAIAHGMWSKARCLSAFQNDLQDMLCCQVSFNKPLFLPSDVSLFSNKVEGESRHFLLTNNAGEVCHLEGQVFNR